MFCIDMFFLVKHIFSVQYSNNVFNNIKRKMSIYYYYYYY